MSFHLLISLLCLISTVFAGVISFPKEDSNNNVTAALLPQGYAVGTPVFVGEAYGQKFKLSGTISDVIAQLEVLHAGKNLTSAGGPFFANNTSSSDDVSLGKRDGPLCIPVAGQPWRMTNTYAIDAAISDIASDGLVIVLPPRKCSRINCRGNAGIWVCVDAAKEITLRGTAIASAARYLQINCGRQLNSPPYWRMAGGQLFDWRGFNTILREDSC